MSDSFLIFSVRLFVECELQKEKHRYPKEYLFLHIKYTPTANKNGQNSFAVKCVLSSVIASINQYPRTKVIIANPSLISLNYYNSDNPIYDAPLSSESTSTIALYPWMVCGTSFKQRQHFKCFPLCPQGGFWLSQQWLCEWSCS